MAIKKVSNQVIKEEAWATYAPTTGLNVGTGGSLVAKYLRVGSRVDVNIHATLGTSFTIPTGLTFSLPVTGTATAHVGCVNFADVTYNMVFGSCRKTSTTAITVDGYAVAGSLIVGSQITSTVPFTWATGDQINLSLTYEAA